VGGDRPSGILRASRPKYYKHGTTVDVFNHIRRIYDEVTSGSQVRGWLWTEDGAYDGDHARIARVR
jgi:hypothetical protein